MARWAQGEHVALVGDTGSGKTFLESRLLPYRGYTLVLRSKPDDIRFPGHRRIRSVAELGAHDRYVLQPKYERQALEFAAAMDHVWQAGGWCIDLDELYYLTLLKLESRINKLLTQGRSKGISVICGMQRPTGVTRFALSQATHWFVFASEGRDLRTLSDAGSPGVAEIVPKLRRYEFAYWNRRTREIAVGKAQQLAELFGG